MMMETKNYLQAELEQRLQVDPTIWRFIRSGSLDGVWYWDLENPENEWMSPEFWRLFGVDPATKAHRATEWQDIIFPDDLALALENFNKHCADPAHPYDQVVRYRHADGGVVWVRCRGLAVRDDDGKPIRMIGAHNDITELMQVTRLRETVLDTVTNGVVALSTDARVRLINPAARRILGGVTAEPPFPWPKTAVFFSALDLSPLTGEADPIARALAGQDLGRDTLILGAGAAEEDYRYVRLAAARIDQEAEEPLCVIAFDDVSVSERQRQQIERASRLEALGQLTGGVAHDFNNILATVQYSMHLALIEDLSKSAEELVRTSLAAVERGADLANRLLAFAKAQPGRLQPHRVGAVFDSAIRLMRPTIASNIEVKTRLADPELLVRCDRGQLETALINLILNARDAIVVGDRGDSVILEARALDLRRIEIAVVDNGPGMSVEVKRRAIDPFFTTKASGSGTGLGLSTVYGFAQQMGGELSIDSEPGAGAAIRLVLPRADMGEDAASTPADEVLLGGGETVLIVEDQRDLLATIAQVVESLGYQAMTAANGVEALALLEGGAAIDVLLTDIVMPGGVGGFELAARARALRPDLPLIYMSGYAGLSADDVGAAAPMLAKPCAPSELSQALRAVLTKGGALRR